MAQPSDGGGYAYTAAPLPTPTRQQLLEAGINIAIGIPMERTITDWAFIHFWQIARRGWPMVDHVYSRTDINRNRLGKWLRDHPEYTHVVMLDLDHLHPADVVERLAAWVLEDPSRLVVGGMHFRRAAPFDPCAFVFGPDGQLHAPVNWEPGLFEVHAIGHGTLLVAREVFERLPEPWWAYTYERVEENVFPSEDMWFSYLCRENGVKLWVDTTLTSPHIILNVVDADTFQRYVAENPDTVQTLRPVEDEESVGAQTPSAAANGNAVANGRQVVKRAKRPRKPAPAREAAGR